MIIEEIKHGIKEWNETRKMVDKSVHYMTNGMYFEIERTDYLRLREMDPSSVHVYLVPYKGSMKMVLIDSVSDREGIFRDDRMFIKDFNKGMDMSRYTQFIEMDESGDIEVITALKRIFKWNLLRDSWITNEILRSRHGLFQAFCIPIDDLNELFMSETQSKALAVLGLTENNEAHFILWAEDASRVIAPRVEDIVLPVPPFGGEHPESAFQLLIQSILSIPGNTGPKATK